MWLDWRHTRCSSGRNRSAAVDEEAEFPPLDISFYASRCQTDSDRCGWLRSENLSGGGGLRKRTVHHPNGAVLIVVQKLPSAVVMNLLRNLLLKVISWNLQEVDDTYAVIVNISSSVYVCVCVCPFRKRLRHLLTVKGTVNIFTEVVEGNHFLFLFIHQSTSTAHPERHFGS